MQRFYTTEDLHRAEEFSRTRHEGQFRRDGTTPYFDGHITKVISILKFLLATHRIDKDSNNAILILIVGYLHDLIEDGRATEKEIEDLFGKEVAVYTWALVIDKTRDYHDQVRELASEFVLRLVKAADNLANITDDPTPKQKTKYIASLAILMATTQ